MSVKEEKQENQEKQEKQEEKQEEKQKEKQEEKPYSRFELSIVRKCGRVRDVAFDEEYNVWASGSSLIPFRKVSDSEEYDEDSENEELEKDEYGYKDIKKLEVTFLWKR